jgi:DNA-binding NarL/FixJ family response regulator
MFLSALAEGARGFLGRSTDRARLVRSLTDVAEGRLAISERLAERLAAEYVAKADGRRTGGRGHPGYVTERELEILQLLSRGMTNGAIAQSLYLSENTVRAHIRNIVLKLNAENRVQAVARAMNLGLLQPQPASNGMASAKAAQLPA